MKILDKMILKFIHWYLDKHNNEIKYHQNGHGFVIRKFSRGFYDDELKIAMDNLRKN